jgi:hypothetical protein
MKIYERKPEGEVRALARLLNVSEAEMLRRGREVQPELVDLEDMTTNTYYYLMGILLGKQSKVAK